MIRDVKIKNFKSIIDEKIELKQLNLLCGENASGKTSIIHAILIAVQRLQSSSNFDGDILKIGDYSELRNFENGSDISIEINTDNGRNRKVTLKKSDDEGVILETSPNEFVLEFEKDVYYISSNRTGKFDVYSKDNSLFGMNGGAGVSFLFENRDNQMPELYMSKFASNHEDSLVKDNPGFLAHVRWWFEYITQETLNIEPISHTNQFVLTYGGSEKNIRPINTGSGFSFVLPLVILCLGAVLRGERPTIIIENPEIYLHPGAQIKMCEFFKFISSFTQLIIETHSECVLKALMEDEDRDTQIILLKKEEGKSKISYLNNSNFVLSPISYAEVLYSILGILTPDLHIALFSALHEKYNNSINKSETRIIEFDKYLCDTFPDVPRKVREHNSTTYNTLCSFIRNCIDHPEQSDSNGHKYVYTESELKKSIDFMIAKFNCIR